MDIVERLRRWHTPGETITGDVQLYLDAADEIASLRSERDKLQADLALLGPVCTPLLGPDASPTRTTYDAAAVDVLIAERDKFREALEIAGKRDVTMECKILVDVGPVPTPGYGGAANVIIGWRCETHGYYQPGNQPITDPPGAVCPIGMIEAATDKAIARIAALSPTRET